MKKRVISVILSVSLIFGCLGTGSIFADADKGYQECYLQILQDNEYAISQYIWQMGYYGFGSMTEENTPRPVNIIDITGDGIPELIYVAADAQYSTCTNLHIYGYCNGEAEELYNCGWDYYVGGGFGYVLFKTSDDPSLFVFYSEGDAWREDNYDVFKTEDDGEIELKQLYQYSNHEGSSSERDIHYYASGIECDETAYTSGKNEIQGKITEIVMMSKGCDQTIGAENLINSAMTYEEAISLLSREVEQVDDITVDIGKYIGTWENLENVTLYINSVTGNEVSFSYAFYRLYADYDLTATLSGNIATYNGETKISLIFGDNSITLRFDEAPKPVYSLYGNNEFTFNQKSWSSTYEWFVTQYAFIDWGSEDYGAETDYLVGLYDMDKDGTPELIIHNGYAGRALRCAYCYAFDGTGIVFAGVCPSEAYYLKNSSYSGLFGRYSDSSEAYWSYYSKSENTISRESVCTEITNVNSSFTQQVTEDDGLFNAFNGDKLYFDRLYTIEEIQNMGWETFITLYYGKTEEVMEECTEHTWTCAYGKGVYCEICGADYWFKFGRDNIGIKNGSFLNNFISTQGIWHLNPVYLLDYLSMWSIGGIALAFNPYGGQCFGLAKMNASFSNGMSTQDFGSETSYNLSTNEKIKDAINIMFCSQFMLGNISSDFFRTISSRENQLRTIVEKAKTMTYRQCLPTVGFQGVGHQVNIIGILDEDLNEDYYLVLLNDSNCLTCPSILYVAKDYSAAYFVYITEDNEEMNWGEVGTILYYDEYDSYNIDWIAPGLRTDFGGAYTLRTEGSTGNEYRILPLLNFDSEVEQFALATTENNNSEMEDTEIAYRSSHIQILLQDNVTATISNNQDGMVNIENGKIINSTIETMEFTTVSGILKLVMETDSSSYTCITTGESIVHINNGGNIGTVTSDSGITVLYSLDNSVTVEPEEENADCIISFYKKDLIPGTNAIAVTVNGAVQSTLTIDCTDGGCNILSDDLNDLTIDVLHADDDFTTEEISISENENSISLAMTDGGDIKAVKYDGQAKAEIISHQEKKTEKPSRTALIILCCVLGIAVCVFVLMFFFGRFGNENKLNQLITHFEKRTETDEYVKKTSSEDSMEESTADMGKQ